ncbi:MAG: PAC2 family protein [Deltaproteobacteria bacterium]|jgi:proteasome assembly chaperone (PAC2) family protein|nr:PAC2 family protein [Deltaproteobacteria bacterium]
MRESGIQINELPELRNPLLIAGFDGWGNALKISSGMAAYLIRTFKAQQFAEIDPDVFFSYDEMRPVVNIEDGMFKRLSPPGGSFYAARTAPDGRDLVILKTDEPNLRWRGFVEELFDLCKRLNIESVITLGSMYDHVLHTDKIISAVTTNPATSSMLRQKGVNSISYQGPSAIHSTIHAKALESALASMSLWCHCPYYLQGTTHFGILAHLGKLLASLGGFELDTTDLETSWEKLKAQIEKLVENNTELQAVIKELRKAKVRGSAAEMKGAIKSDEKVINIQDFLEPK